MAQPLAHSKNFKQIFSLTKVSADDEEYAARESKSINAFRVFQYCKPYPQHRELHMPSKRQALEDIDRELPADAVPVPRPLFHAQREVQPASVAKPEGPPASQPASFQKIWLVQGKPITLSMSPKGKDESEKSLERQALALLQNKDKPKSKLNAKAFKPLVNFKDLNVAKELSLSHQPSFPEKPQHSTLNSKNRAPSLTSEQKRRELVLKIQQQLEQFKQVKQSVHLNNENKDRSNQIVKGPTNGISKSPITKPRVRRPEASKPADTGMTPPATQVATAPKSAFVKLHPHKESPKPSASLQTLSLVEKIMQLRNQKTKFAQPLSQLALGEPRAGSSAALGHELQQILSKTNGSLSIPRPRRSETSKVEDRK